MCLLSARYAGGFYLGFCMKSKKEERDWFPLEVVRQQNSAFWIVTSQYSLHACLSRRVAVHQTILPVAATAVMSRARQKREPVKG
jgi:hypothetical protein